MKTILVTNGVKDITNKTQYQHSELFVENHDTIILSKNQVAPDIEEQSTSTHNFENYPGPGFLFPYWALCMSFYYVLCKRYMTIVTTHSTQCLFVGCISLLTNSVWIADIWDDPQLGHQISQFKNAQAATLIPNKIYSRLFSTVVMKLLRHSDLIILSIHQDIVSEWNVSIDNDKILKVTNGVDIEYTRSNVNNNVKKEDGTGNSVGIVYVGHVGKQRGADTIIKSSKILKEEYTDEFRISLIGPISQEDRKVLEEEITDFGVENHTEILGKVEHKTALQKINSADICVNILPRDINNYNFAFPIKIFEYMALEKPIISSSTDGIEKILQDGENSILLSSNNPAELATAIYTVSENDSLRENLGENAKKTSEEFEWSVIRKEIKNKLA